MSNNVLQIEDNNNNKPTLNVDNISNTKIHEIVLNARMNQINHINQLDQIINVIKKNRVSIRIRPAPSPIEENPIRPYLTEPDEEVNNYHYSDGCKFGMCAAFIILWGVAALYFATR